MAMFEAIDDILKKVSDFNEYSKALVTLASAVGVLVITFYTIKSLFGLIQYTRLYVCSQLGCCQGNLAEKYGKWAVVTGGTDGIGLSMAKELASRGMSILVVSRNKDKLARTKEELEQIPNVGEVETIQVDLSNSSLENFAMVEQQIDPNNRDIGILINNAGTFPDKFQRINRFDMEFLLTIANLNMIAPVHLTRMIMPGMLQRGRGLVVNVSSVLGSLDIPYMSIYAPTKSFLDAFTRQLQIEYASHPIDIVLLTPGPVHTKLLANTSKLPKASIINPTPDDYAKCAINALATRINNFSGTPMHGLINVMGHFTQWLGISQTLYRANLSLSAKNVYLSPVPKRRKRQVQLVAASDDDGAAAAGGQQNTAQ